MDKINSKHRFLCTMIPPYLKMITKLGHKVGLMLLVTLIHLLENCTGIYRYESLIPHDKKWRNGVRIPSGYLRISSVATWKSYHLIFHRFRGSDTPP